jgi:hypothetical protein
MMHESSQGSGPWTKRATAVKMFTVYVMVRSCQSWLTASSGPMKIGADIREMTAMVSLDQLMVCRSEMTTESETGERQSSRGLRFKAPLSSVHVSWTTSVSCCYVTLTASA